MNQRVSSRMLETRGCETTVMANGLEAIQAFLEGAHNLILMDCQMPELNGLGATKTIRKL